MMKKLIALLLALALTLGCCAVFADEEEAPAEETAAVTDEAVDAVPDPDAKYNLGQISINGAFTLMAKLPEGYSLQYQEANQDSLIAVMFKEDDLEAPAMTLQVAFDETWSHIERMNDATEEELAMLEATYTEQDPTVELSFATTNYGTLLLVAKQLGRERDYMVLMSIYKGYFIEFAVTAGPAATDRNLTDEQILPCVQFLSDLDFIPAGEEGEGVNLAGKTYKALMGSYNEEKNTVSMTLKETVTLHAEAAEAIAAGDKVVLGPETVDVETVDVNEYGDIVLNDDIYLVKQDNGDYAAKLYGDEDILQIVIATEVEIPETAVFLDNVAPETFEMLDEPVQHTAKEFIEMLTAHDDADVGFTSDNVEVTFDEDGVLTLINRFYAPWQ